MKLINRPLRGYWGSTLLQGKLIYFAEGLVSRLLIDVIDSIEVTLYFTKVYLFSLPKSSNAVTVEGYIDLRLKQVIYLSCIDCVHYWPYTYFGNHSTSFVCNAELLWEKTMLG